MPFGLSHGAFRSEPAAEAALQLPRKLASRCTRTGCSEGVGWTCAYRDRKGEQCDTWWCKDHVEFVGDLPFCRRHASVVKTINKTRGTVREIKTVPELSDRSTSLVNIVADDLDEPIIALLQNLYRGRRDVTISADSTPRDVWVERKEVAWDTYSNLYMRRTGKHLHWERSWAALNNQGHLTRVAIRVSTSEPPVVQALVGVRPVAEGTPDWILSRMGGHRHDVATDRAIFRDKLLHAIADSL